MGILANQSWRYYWVSRFLWCWRHCSNWREILSFMRHEGPLERIVLRDESVIYLDNGQASFDIFLCVWRRREYAIDGHRVPSAGVVVDVGANVGIFSVWASRLLVPKGQVYAFEPVPSTFEFLQRAVGACPRKNIRPFCKAVMDVPGRIRVWVGDESGHSTVAAGNSADTGGEAVVDAEATTLEAVLSTIPEGRIDLLKLDCEGSEYPILSATPAAVFERVGAIAMEYHNLDESRNRETAVRRLTERGFDVVKATQPDQYRCGIIHAVPRRVP